MNKHSTQITLAHIIKINVLTDYLRRPVVASSFSCRKVCSAPYTCALDSAPYSSASMTTVPQGHAPATIPMIINELLSCQLYYNENSFVPAVRLFTRTRSFSVLHTSPTSSSEISKMLHVEFSSHVLVSTSFIHDAHTHYLRYQSLYEFS